MTIVYGSQYPLGFDSVDDDDIIDRKAVIRAFLSDMRETPQRELLHEMIIDIARGVDD